MKANTMKPKTGCTGPTASKLIFACSGAADVGALADRVARQLTVDGVGKMSCLAGIAGGVRAAIETARGASKILVIDGCAQECGRKTLERAGVSGFRHLMLGTLGFYKGSSPVTDDRIQAAANKGAELLR